MLPLKIEIAWVSDPEGDGEFYRLCVSGADTFLACLPLPVDAPLSTILAAALGAVSPTIERARREDMIARMLRQGLRHEDIAAVCETSKSTVERTAYRLGLARGRGRPPEM